MPGRQVPIRAQPGQDRPDSCAIRSLERLHNAAVVARRRFQTFAASPALRARRVVVYG